MPNQLPANYEMWIRQKSLAQDIAIGEPVDKVYQISRMTPGQERAEVICSCGKKSAQRLLAGLAIHDGPECYRLSAIFFNLVLPGFTPLEH